MYHWGSDEWLANLENGRDRFGAQHSYITPTFVTACHSRCQRSRTVISRDGNKTQSRSVAARPKCSEMRGMKTPQ